MELQMGTNLAWVPLTFIHTLISSEPVIADPHFLPSQVVLLYVLFRGRHESF